MLRELKMRVMAQAAAELGEIFRVLVMNHDGGNAIEDVR